MKQHVCSQKSVLHNNGIEIILRFSDFVKCFFLFFVIKSIFIFGSLLEMFIYLFMFKNLFIFGCIGSSLLHVAFSSCGERGVLLLVVVCGLLIVEVSLVAEHGL